MRLHINSLQSRIVLFHLVAIILTAITVPLVNYLVISQSANQFEAQTLRAHAATIGQYLQSDAQNSWHLDLPDDLRTLYAHELDGLSYEVVDATGHVLFASGRNNDAGAIPITNSHLAHISRNGTVLYGMTLEHRGNTGAVQIKVAQNIQHPDVIFDDIVAAYLARMGWLTVVILTMLLAVDIFIIRNALAPVLHASKVASAIDPERTDLRLPTAGVPRELLPLIQAMNEALGRLEKGIRLQREFTADAAHELRTPLAVLRARVDTFPNQEVTRSLKADLEVMTRIISQLLDIAEIEGATLALNASCDLRETCCDVVSALADLAITQGKEIALTGDNNPVWILGSPAMIYRAVRNLVDNAVRYTPRGTAVEVEVISDGSVRVKDCGTGVPEPDRPFVFRRFWRADRGNSDGAGLGLAIVSRITEMHHAKVEISDRIGGGAIFSLSFRLAPHVQVSV